MPQTRRTFLRTGALTAGALAMGPAFWREALAAPAVPGPGPYGALGAPDANGLALPQGFTARLIARGNQPVAGSPGDVFHIFPDGAATYATDDGGWILVSNSENPASPDLPGEVAGVTGSGGGAGALRFRADGQIADYYRILSGTSTNCAGGATPWGTWMSCEEVEDGQVWECDPTGERAAVARPAMGVFKHEAVAVDPFGRRIYLTEDLGDSGLYRFTPDRWPDCSSGMLEIASVRAGGVVRWIRIPDPSGQVAPTRHQIAEATEFKRGEGIWFDSGIVYVATTSDSKIHAYDTVSETIDVLYDADAIPDPPLKGVDNIVVSKSGDLFVCEDNGEDSLDIGIITPERQVTRFLTLTGTEHSESEITGAAFDPSGSRLYFSSQRAAGPGALFEVSGPFRTQRPPDRTRPRIRLVAARTVSLEALRRRGMAASVTTDEPTDVVVKLHARIGGRRVTLARAKGRVAAAGESPKIRLRLSKAARTELRGRRLLNATLTASARDGGGNTRKASRDVRLRSAKR